MFGIIIVRPRTEKLKGKMIDSGDFFNMFVKSLIKNKEYEK